MSNIEFTPIRLDYREINVTPELADEWLKLNVSNRNKKPVKIEAFSKLMRDGGWMVNGETIKFTGPVTNPTHLIDGQNRLTAVIRAGVPAIIGVFFNVPQAAQETLDSGTKRTVADNLKIEGVKNHSIVAAAAAIALRVRDGNLNGGAVRVTNYEAQQFIRDNPGLHEAAAVASRYHHRAQVAPSFIAYSYWEMSKVSPTDAIDFWESAAEKTNLRPGDPVIAMTNKFVDFKIRDQKLYVSTALSMIFRAWNYRRQGKPMQTMKVLNGKGNPIGIPELV